MAETNGDEGSELSDGAAPDPAPKVYGSDERKEVPSGSARPAVHETMGRSLADAFAPMRAVQEEMHRQLAQVTRPAGLAALEAFAQVTRPVGLAALDTQIGSLADAFAPMRAVQEEMHR